MFLNSVITLEQINKNVFDSANMLKNCMTNKEFILFSLEDTLMLKTFERVTIFASS